MKLAELKESKVNKEGQYESFVVYLRKHSSNYHDIGTNRYGQMSCIVDVTQEQADEIESYGLKSGYRPKKTTGNKNFKAFTNGTVSFEIDTSSKPFEVHVWVKGSKGDEHIDESTIFNEAEGSDQALKIAASLLNVDQSKLKGVDPDTEAEVLDTAREIKKQFIQMVHGKLFVRLYKAANKLFARIEYPDGENKLYTA